MDIYSHEGTEGILDIHKARHELAKTGPMAPETRRACVAEITAAALLDIAYSLRPVGAEAAAAMSPYAYAEAADYRVAEGVVEVEATSQDFFTVGDLVAVASHDEPAEITGFGFDQGEAFAMIVFASGADTRVWLSNLTRLVGDDADDDAMQEAAEASVEAVHESEAGTILETAREVEALVDEAIGVAAHGEPDVEPEDDFGPGDPAPVIDEEHEVDPLAGGTALDTLKAKTPKKKAGKK